MDDEEEDMSRPISQIWGTPFRDIKYEERATQMAGQALAVGPTPQSHDGISTGRPPCALHWQPRVPFQGEEGRNVSPFGMGGGFNRAVTQLVALLSAEMLIGNRPQRQE